MLDEIRRRGRDPHSAARAFKAQGGVVVGYLGQDVPVELIRAAGMMPVRLTADLEEPAEGARQFSSGGAEPALRSILARLLDGAYDYVDHIVCGATPRPIVSLYVFLRELSRLGDLEKTYALHAYDQARGDGVAARSHNRKQADKLVQRLEEWAGQRISEAPLQAALKEYGALRQGFQTLSRLRAERRICGVDAYLTYAAASWTPVAEMNRDVASMLEACQGSPSLPGLSTVYSGSPTYSVNVYQRLEASGLLIVGDDQEWGQRGWEIAAPEAGDPILALVEAYRRRAPSPAGWPLPARRRYLADLVRHTQAEAVIFAFAAFDHPPAWEYAALRDMLAEMGVRHARTGGRFYRQSDEIADLAGCLGRRFEEGHA